MQLKNPQLHVKQLVTDSLSTSGGNRTHTPLPEQDFESSASTSSATEAIVRAKIVNYFIL